MSLMAVLLPPHGPTLPFELRGLFCKMASGYIECPQDWQLQKCRWFTFSSRSRTFFARTATWLPAVAEGALVGTPQGIHLTAPSFDNGLCWAVNTSLPTNCALPQFTKIHHLWVPPIRGSLMLLWHSFIHPFIHPPISVNPYVGSDLVLCDKSTGIWQAVTIEDPTESLPLCDSLSSLPIQALSPSTFC